MSSRFYIFGLIFSGLAGLTNFLILLKTNDILLRSGSSGVSTVSGLLLLLAVQIGFNPDYDYPDNFLTSNSKVFMPQRSVSVSDNACQRSKYNASLSFDFIIVGSGAAGSVIASRLSENPNFKVLLIEAGGDPLLDSIVPQLFPFGLNHSMTKWDHYAVEDGNVCNAFKNGCTMTYGKQLGGTTSINGLVYICGTDRDYDSWASQGNIGWDYASMLTYIKKSRSNMGGPLSVTADSKPDPTGDVLRNAFSELGYKTMQEFDGRQFNGEVEVKSTVKNGERASAYTAFIAPVYRNRKNLTIMKNSLVTKVLFSGTTATGVNVKTGLGDCPNIVISATKEVILSAGGQGSPKILLQSGVGKFSDLSRGVKQVVNLPVGENFQDHVASIHLVKINPNAPKETLLKLLSEVKNYFFHRTGKLTELGLSALAFINLTDSNATYPDIEIETFQVERELSELRPVLRIFGYKEEFITQLVEINKNYELFMIYAMLLNPKSRGTIKLRGSDPDLPPKIITNFLSHPDDVQTMIRSIEKIQKLVNTPALTAISAELIKFDIPDCNDLPYPSNDYWKCYIKFFTSSSYHPVGTCKMGNDSEESVVDARLRVHGVSKLRVADASIMPTITSGNLQCPVYAIGEKAADMIKADWA